jgi:hypothetical protein
MDLFDYVLSVLPDIKNDVLSTILTLLGIGLILSGYYFITSILLDSPVNKKSDDEDDE